METRKTVVRKQGQPPATIVNRKVQQCPPCPKKKG
jgi:hypothetical protein